ncbi:hypothetical protein LTR37_001629 [Vermiconidia calcicola]|uniref:Uncharacterized protein n=1 Tax=Vermiconidia calcicola TaxID=1690605 RepID=A0ACC3NVV0_9PEZI|nr:hypothetical protein LTR37_001629 [Vermiconidia calcicola]
MAQSNSQEEGSTLNADGRLDSLPSLRFEDGDVVIKLGESADEWLLVHRSIIRETMPVLAVALSEDWNRGEKCIDPKTEEPLKDSQTGKFIQKYSFGLKFVDRVWLSDGRDFDHTKQSQISDHISCSVYSDGGWPVQGWIGDTSTHILEPVAKAHRSLFAILYGFPINLPAMQGGVRWSWDDTNTLCHDLDEIITIYDLLQYFEGEEEGPLELRQSARAPRLPRSRDLWPVDHSKARGTAVGRGFGNLKTRDTGGLTYACKTLTEAAAWDDPTRLFGFKVAPRISSIFSLGRKWDSEKHIQRALNDIVYTAAGIIGRTFETCEETLADGTVLTYRRCEYDTHFKHFTYMPLDEQQLPWADEAATAEKLRFFGFMGDGNENDGNGEGSSRREGAGGDEDTGVKPDDD